MRARPVPAPRRSAREERCVRVVTRSVVATAGAVVALYALTVVGVWGVALFVDLRGDVAVPPNSHLPKEKS